MIKVLKRGNRKYLGKCSRCGCEFQYELSDLDCAEMVYCPECGKRIGHLKDNAIMTKDEDPTIVRLIFTDDGTTESNEALKFILGCLENIKGATKSKTALNNISDLEKFLGIRRKKND